MRDFEGLYLAIGCSDRRSPGADGDGKGRTYWDDMLQVGIVPVRAKKSQKEGCNTRTSQEVTHPSTTLALARLTVEF